MKGGIFAALFLFGCLTVVADSGVGVDGESAAAVNGGVPELGREPADQPLNPLHPNTRSPSGLLYPTVHSVSTSAYGEWLGDIRIELGGLATSGSDRRAGFVEYADWDDGLIVSRFTASLTHPDSSRYLEVNGGALGRDDQHFDLRFGRYGRFELRGFSDAIPHVFATNARVLWSGAGTDRLTLPAGLVPGNVSADVLRQAFSQTGESVLALDREKFGLGISLTPTPDTRLFAKASSENRDGTRALGGAMGYPGFGQLMETVEPIDYRTTDVSLGFAYAGSGRQFNATYAGSFFRNDYESLTWENAGGFDFPSQQNLGRLALPPDNDYHNLKLDYAQVLPKWRGRLTATASATQMEQDEALLPPTVAGGIQQGVDLDQWNTVGALSQTTADAERSHLMTRLKLTLQPTSRLRLSGLLRNQEQDNDSRYLAFNPQTGQYGYIGLDGGLSSGSGRGGLFDPGISGSRVRIASIPFEKNTFKAEIKADYRLTRKLRLGVSAVRDEADYQHRERNTVDDNRLRLQLNRRGQGSFRVSYEYLDRSGDVYDFDPYESFYSTSLPGFIPEFGDQTRPHTLANLRKYDLADQQRHQLELRYLRVLADALDLNVQLGWEDADYDADYGLRGVKKSRLGLDLTWRPQHNTDVYAFYNYQSHDRRVANIASDAGNVFTSSPDPNAGGDIYPLENAWSEAINETNQVFGLGYHKVFDRVELNLQYSLIDSDSRVRYTFSSVGALVRGPGSQADAGSGFPDLSFENQLLEANLRWQVRTNLAIRFLIRYEKEDIDDFHYLGLTQPTVSSDFASDVYLAAVPQDYSAGVFGILFEYAFAPSR